MTALEKIFQRASADPRSIVLAEGNDPRILEAAVSAAAQGIADITVLGNVDEVKALAVDNALDLTSIAVLDPTTSDAAERYAQALFEKRKAKGMTEEKAAELIRDPLYYAQMMVHLGDADGSVAGAVYTTGDVVRGAIQIIGMSESSSMVSSFFLMMMSQPHHDVQGGIVFSDCGLVIDPDAQQLSQIAMSAAASAQTMLGEEPRVAMLSFSTHGSANHPAVDKVAEATRLVREQMPDLKLDGEVQFDAAIVPAIAERKVKDSQVNGQANVLVFPSLEAGNIGYKIAERIGKAEAIGPVLQGLKKPANDLSRGCSAKDVVNVIAITVLQAQNL